MKTSFLVIRQKIKFLLFKLIDAFIFPAASINQNTLLIIRLDLIGDYILFRNFLSIVRNSAQYRNYHITLLGNMIWKNVSEILDIEFIDKFIWIDLALFNYNIAYRYQKLKEYSSAGYYAIVNPTYSREFFYDDWIINLIPAIEKIGSSGEQLTVNDHWQRRIGDRFYTKLIPAERNQIFEFYRNKDFFEKFLNNPLEISKPSINIENIPQNIALPEKYAILFIGASDKIRKWPLANFATIANYLNNKYLLDIVLCGRPDDLDDIVDLDELFTCKYLNLIGKTTLADLIRVISHGALLVSNETLAPHIGVALNIPSIVLSNGNHLGRFTPYPREMTQSYNVIFHPEIKNHLDKYKKISGKYGFVSTLSIDEICTCDVIRELDRLLNKAIEFSDSTNGSFD